jgi:hypothetical protein
MFRYLIHYIRRYRHKKLVRPWALSAPILVLLIALPLLRPLRMADPDLRHVSDDEQARLATVQAIVENHSLAIDATNFTTTTQKIEVTDRAGRYRWYSEQPPMMSAMLSPAYYVMRQRGLTFKSNAPAVLYLLTLLGVTVPAACCAGLVYRMGRLFELSRPWRALLAAASVLATGVISYSTVLSPHVPAATFLLASAACLVHLSIAKNRPLTPIWLAVSGICAALAAAIDPSAIPFFVLFPAVIVSLRLSSLRRLAGLLAYAIGAAGPILVHAALTVPVTHDFWQGTGAQRASSNASSGHREASDSRDASEEDDDVAPSSWQSAAQVLARLAAALGGEHGLLSHFPVLLMGVVGGSMIMHRHWPSSAKVLASATVAGAVFLIVAYSVHLKDWRQWRDAMFAARWFIVFGPLLLFWAGAWLRRSHKLVSWVAVGILLTFSVAVSLIGATGPLPRDGFDRYTAAGALGNLLHPPTTTETATTLVDR